MIKQTLCVTALALVAACGIAKDQYNAKVLEAEDLSRKYKDEEGKSASLEQKVKDLDGQLLNKEAERKRLEQKNTELTALKGKMTVKMKDKILFASGSARIGKEGQDALAKVADAFKNLQGKIVRVEGHTDDVPTDPKSAFPSNWELSLARAMAVVKYMQDQGVDPTLLSAAGYGQYHPIAPNDSPENRSQNRRIEIVLAPAG